MTNVSKDASLEEDSIRVIDSNDRGQNESADNVFWEFLAKISKKLDSLGVETRGIERIEPYERSTNPTKQLISVIGLWISASGGLTSMSSFFLGPLLYELGLRKTLVSGLISQTIGCVVAAYCSLMGPRSGCRQMVTARFLFGWWSVKFVSFVSIVGVFGWSVVNSVVGGQILTSVSNEKIPLVVGIILVALISLMVAIAGIKQLLRVEAFLSIPVNVAFLLLYVVSSQKFDYLSNADATEIAKDSATLRGNWLCFFSLCYSVTSTWGSIASDYYILFPEDTPDTKIFCLTFFGIMIPTTFVGTAGLLIGNVAMSYEPWSAAYESYGMGGLLDKAFEPWGAGGKFLLMVIFLSLVSNNILNTYSAAFGIQLAASFFAKIPRWIWAFAVTACYLVCALVGRNHFSNILGNFLPMVGYWISIYFMILLEENSIFRTRAFIHLYTKERPFDTDISREKSLTSSLRPRQNYNFKIWNDYDCLTKGYAATVAFLFGAAGAVLGMAQTYWIGPLAKAVGGTYGGDIGMWLAMGFSGLVYPVLRYWELKTMGR